jgi:hypothetical protein
MNKENTTINITDENWHYLTKIKVQYCGRNSTYNDVITLLLDNFTNKNQLNKMEDKNGNNR